MEFTDLAKAFISVPGLFIVILSIALSWIILRLRTSSSPKAEMLINLARPIVVVLAMACGIVGLFQIAEISKFGPYLSTALLSIVYINLLDIITKVASKK